MLELFITAVIVLVVAGLVIWIVDAFLPIDARFKSMIRVVVIIGAALYLIYMLLQVLGYAS